MVVGDVPETVPVEIGNAFLPCSLVSKQRESVREYDIVTEGEGTMILHPCPLKLLPGTPCQDVVVDDVVFAIMLVKPATFACID